MNESNTKKPSKLLSHQNYFFSVITLSLAMAACQGSKEDKQETAVRSYNYEVNGCSTDRQDFNSLETYCVGLRDEVRNKGCARSLREEAFQRDCRNVDLSKVPGAQQGVPFNAQSGAPAGGSSGAEASDVKAAKKEEDRKKMLKEFGYFSDFKNTNIDLKRLSGTDRASVDLYLEENSSDSTSASKKMELAVHCGPKAKTMDLSVFRDGMTLFKGSFVAVVRPRAKSDSVEVALSSFECSDALSYEMGKLRHMSEVQLQKLAVGEDVHVEFAEGKKMKFECRETSDGHPLESESTSKVVMLKGSQILLNIQADKKKLLLTCK